MSKTKEELEQLKKQFEELQAKKEELSQEELQYVTGGCGEDEPEPIPNPKYSAGQRIHKRGRDSSTVSDYTDYIINSLNEEKSVAPNYYYNVTIHIVTTFYTLGQVDVNDSEHVLSESEIDRFASK